MYPMEDAREMPASVKRSLDGTPRKRKGAVEEDHPDLALGSVPEVVDGERMSVAPPLKEALRMTANHSISSLLQNHILKNLTGWNPNRPVDGVMPLVHSDVMPSSISPNLNRTLSPKPENPKPNPPVEPIHTSPIFGSPCPSLVLDGPSQSSAGHTPFPSRSSTLVSSDFLNGLSGKPPPAPIPGSKNQTASLALRPPNRLPFHPITSDILQSLMDPVCMTKNFEDADTDKDGVEDEEEEEDEVEEDEDEAHSYEEESARRKRNRERKLFPELDKNSLLRAVETWEDLEESLRDPRPFFIMLIRPPASCFLLFIIATWQIDVR
ncbi:hypothetical protein NE237_014218 [Protea cynaroides]|uniref:Uncharacterized protein n=1 Tax=Protea cynaroides TaxID=273540 RepID=A0A9Q0GLH9_9MAGN|nr:hypothetical protein NE237_014218 [Protea cynaroides]